MKETTKQELRKSPIGYFICHCTKKACPCDAFMTDGSCKCEAIAPICDECGEPMFLVNGSDEVECMCGEVKPLGEVKQCETCSM